MSRKPPSFAIGDRIAYSAQFLRSTGQHSGRAPFMRATVTNVGAVVSTWGGAIIAFRTDDGQESGGLACNFVHVAKIAADAALGG